VAIVSISIIPTPAPSPAPIPPSTSSCDPKSKTIQEGAKGAKVIELQTHLTTLGYGALLGKHGPKQVGIDGIFGDDTKKAVIKFQQDKHLKSTNGIVGPETWGAICSALSPMTRTSMIKETKNFYHEIAFVTPINLVAKEPRAFDDQMIFGQDYRSNYHQVQSDDFPAIDYEGLANDSTIKNATVPSENVTEALPSENITQPLTKPNATTTTASPPTGTIGEQLVCSDGFPPDPSNGLCADGYPPPAANVTASPPDGLPPQSP
jgi:peptidoglycan hydrolase-like protein with peptidoglycan-binding domain